MSRSQCLLPFGRRGIVAFAMIVFAAYATMIPIGAVTSVSGSAANAQSPAPVKIGAPAPDIAFTAVDGTERRLSEFHGQPVMLWFYASWYPVLNVRSTCTTSPRARGGPRPTASDRRPDGPRDVVPADHAHHGPDAPAAGSATPRR